MSGRSSNSIFGISTIPQYIAFCEQAVAALADDQGDVVKGFTAILALNHVPDWLEQKVDGESLREVGIVFQKDPRTKRDDIEALNPNLTLCRDIANGFKHLKRAEPTSQVKGYGQGPYGVGPYGVPYLLIDLGEALDPGARWVTGLGVCQKILEWWKDVLRPIFPDLPK